jgi:hypothetical protein
MSSRTPPSALRPPHSAFRTPHSAFLLLLLAPFLRAADPAEPPPVARLELLSEPPQATVAIDRKVRGETPLTVADLPPGEHLVVVQKRGFAAAYQTVTVAAQDRRTVECKLEPLTGFVLVRSTPTNADVTADGVDLGRTPLLVATLPLGEHRLRIATPGFQPKEVAVHIEDRTPVQVSVDLVSDSATLTVECDVPGATVRVNGMDRGAAPCTTERIPEGEVALEVQAEGYAPFRQQLKLSAGQVQTVKAPLAPLPAALRVVSLPDKARVYLNNEFRGTAPLDLGGLAAGSYRVRVELEGFDPEARTVELARGASKTEEFRLVSNTGRLDVTTEPDGVTVMVDGRKAGETHARPDASLPVSEPLVLDGVAAGEHEVRFLRKGFFEKAQKVRIEQGKALPLHVTLTRRFIPDYQVVTDRGVYRGVLESVTEEFIRLETAPGVMTAIPMKDVKTRQALREDGRTD